MAKESTQYRILCPKNNQSERTYIIKVLFEDYLGLKCNINFNNDVTDYIIEFGENRIVFEDHFFKHFVDELSYLSSENIPESFSKLSGDALPVIFGREIIEINTNEIRCGLDIFASSFFLLTRWEEFVLPKRSDGLRCDENATFLVKNGLANRPIVNEYLNLIIDFFAHFNIKLQPSRNFTIFQTHDVDWVHLSTFTALLKNIRKMVLSQKLYRKSWLIFWKYLYYRLTFSNPFDSFGDFMDFSDRYELKNAFYFKTCTKGEKGYTYDYNDRGVKNIIANILRRGHQIGFHPSENTHQNENQIKVEYERLTKISSEAKGGRQHHLLYDSNTLKTWDRFKLGYDSGYGFQFRNGFRCGICFDFPVFDVYKREQLALREIPFLIMDTAFLRKKSSPAEMLKESKEIIDIVRKYNGILCTVWHTNMFKTLERKKYVETYYRIIQYALNENRKA